MLQEDMGKGNYMENVNYRCEIDEAIRAGQRARNSLIQAKECLKSAGNWGILDMLGGGFITTYIKRSRMNDAEHLVQQARSDLKQFQKELMDVDTIREFHVETGNFLTFADYFLDGLLTDWLVQTKIQEAKRQVDDAIGKVEHILRLLGGF